MSRMSTAGVYAIRNIVTNKVYVGSAKCLSRRWYHHRYHLERGRHHSEKLQRSWDKHGLEAFAFEVLEKVDSGLDLIAREQVWIDTLHAARPDWGYNILYVAGSRLGKGHTADARAKIGVASRGRGKGIPKSLEHRAKISASNLGIEKPGVSEWNRTRVLSDDARARIGEATGNRVRGVKLSEEHCAAISTGLTGRKHTEGTKVLMKAQAAGRGLGKPKSPEHRAKLVAILSQSRAARQNRARY